MQVFRRVPPHRPGGQVDGGQAECRTSMLPMLPLLGHSRIVRGLVTRSSPLSMPARIVATVEIKPAPRRLRQKRPDVLFRRLETASHQRYQNAPNAVFDRSSVRFLAWTPCPQMHLENWNLLYDEPPNEGRREESSGPTQTA